MIRSASKTQIAVYLIGICLFSISFLVFLSATVSFVITDIIKQDAGIGDAVGTLAFADELVALVACPLWGLLSDRIGVSTVAAVGYSIVGLALFVFVQARNVYPQLLLVRILFAVGGAATATMVTAGLPAMTRPLPESPDTGDASSDAVIAPPGSQRPRQLPRLAGFVGAATGCGALLALGLFLPLPTVFARQMTGAEALAATYYVVGGMALLVAAVCFIGLRQLPSDANKGWHQIWLRSTSFSKHLPTYRRMMGQAIVLGYRDSRIGLGYVGGFVARASSVAITLFIPLYINDYFVRSGICDRADPTQIKTQCHQAYVLAAKLTGTSQLVALILAPLYGYLDKAGRLHYPLLVASACGLLGYGSLILVRVPDPASDDGTALVYLAVALTGASQIGAIVCSLSLIGTGITATTEEPIGATLLSEDESEAASPLLAPAPPPIDRRHIQGSVAGIYSLAGGVGILLLTKLGGVLFDLRSPVAPFWMMGAFNVLLLISVLVCSGVEARRLQRA